MSQVNDIENKKPNSKQSEKHTNNTNNSNASPVKGLPGFLRRTLRINIDEEAARSNDDTESKSSASKQDILDNHQMSKNNNNTTTKEAASNSIPQKETKIEKKEGKKPFFKKKKNEDMNVTSDASNARSTSTNSSSPYLPKKTYKESTYEKCIIAPIVNVRDMRKLSWNGIPRKYRPESWKILLGYLPANASRRSNTLQRKRQEYRDAIAQHYDNDDATRSLTEQETLRQVLVDVPRTAPDVSLFRNPRIRKSLQRLLFIWAMRHPASSYVQGINDLATPLVSVFISDYFDDRGRDMTTEEGGDIVDTLSDDIMDEVEADTYWCLTNLLAGIQDHYTSDQPGVQRMVFRLSELVQRIDVDLCNHFQSVGIEFMQFAFKWMNCLLVREFTLSCVIRLWDTYLSEEESGFEDFHVYVCAAFLCRYSSELQHMEFDELFGFLQSSPTANWGDAEVEVLLSQAYVLSTLFRDSDAHLSNSTGSGGGNRFF